MPYSSFNEGSAVGDPAAENLRGAFIKTEALLADIYNVDVSGTPLTSKQNQFFATGNGTDSEAAFRSIVSADIPTNLSLTGITSLEALKKNITVVTDNYTMLSTDSVVIMTIASKAITIPSKTDNNGKIIEIINKSNGGLTVSGNFANRIQGELQYILAPYGHLTLICNEGSSNWEVLNAYNPLYVELKGGNGHGSVATRVRLFSSTTVDNSYGAVTITNSSSTGTSLKILQPGVYSITYADTKTSGGSTSSIGLSLNSSQLTTNINSINISDILGYVASGGTGSQFSGVPSVCTYTGFFEEGDEIRPHTNQIPNSTSLTDVSLTLTRIA